jgi:hypothetical protein
MRTPAPEMISGARHPKGDSSPRYDMTARSGICDACATAGRQTEAAAHWQVDLGILNVQIMTTLTRAAPRLADPPNTSLARGRLQHRRVPADLRVRPPA